MTTSEDHNKKIEEPSKLIEQDLLEKLHKKYDKSDYEKVFEYYK